MGIGRAIATALAKECMRVAVVARRRNLLEELSVEIEKAKGPKLVVIEQDLMHEDAPQKIAAAALEGLGSVDVLVNNAASRLNPARRTGRRRSRSTSPASASSPTACCRR